MQNIETLTVEELFGDQTIQFIIPDFQRSFVWRNEEFENLWNTLVSSYERSSYLGSIVISHQEDKDGCSKYNIIDGQQRLISILIILIICHKLKIDKNPKEQLFYSGCLKNNLKIKPQNYDDIINIVNGNILKTNKFAPVYDYMHTKVLSLEKGLRDNFYTTITSNIKLTAIIASHNDSEAYLFEIINKHGHVLTPKEISKAKDTNFNLEESEYIEFKEGAIYNPHTGEKDRNMINKVLIAVASFMNSEEGGTVYIGIEDKSRLIKGVNREYELANKGKSNWDGYELFIADSIEKNLESIIIFKYYKIKKEIIGNKDICIIEVKPSLKPVFFSDEFYIKTNNEKRG